MTEYNRTGRFSKLSNACQGWMGNYVGATTEFSLCIENIFKLLIPTVISRSLAVSDKPKDINHTFYNISANSFPTCCRT